MWMTICFRYVSWSHPRRRSAPSLISLLLIVRLHVFPVWHRPTLEQCVGLKGRWGRPVQNKATRHIKCDFFKPPPQEGWILNRFQSNLVQTSFVKSYTIPVSSKVKMSKVAVRHPFLCVLSPYLLLIFIQKYLWSFIKANIPYVIPHNLCYYGG